MTSSLNERLRDYLLAICGGVRGSRVAIALSGGIDSTVLAIAALEVGRRVSAYSFTLNDRTSTDFLRAKETANALGINFTPVYLPTDPANVLADVMELVHGFGLRKKTAIECTWPFLYLLRDAANHGIDTVLTGSCADGHFGISKKAMIHARGSVETLDSFRSALFADQNYAQVNTLRTIGDRLGVRVSAPYRALTIQALFQGQPWDAINKPRQKWPIWQTFPAIIDQLPVIKLHQNLQLGDSGIAENFARLVKAYPALAGDGAKSVRSIYNALTKEEIR